MKKVRSHMRYVKYILLFVLCIIGSVRLVYSKDLEAGKKVLVICSYSSDYSWSNLIIDNLNAEIKKYLPRAEIMVEYLSSEKFVDTKLWVERVELLLNGYENELPSAVVLISDEAWMTYREVKNEHFKDVPLFLCAVKPQSLDLFKYTNKRDELSFVDFVPTEQLAKEYNATGIIRNMNIEGMIDLMGKVIPNLENYAFITDNRFYGIYTRLSFEDYISKSNINKHVDYFDARFINADTLLVKLSQIEPNTGVLLTSWNSSVQGFQYSTNYLYDNMVSIMKTPIFVTTDMGVGAGNFIGGCFIAPGFWGREVADMVLRVLGGIDVNKLPIKTLTESEFQINWNVLKKYNLSHENLPASTKYTNRPKSIFVAYKKELFIFTALTVLLILGFIYVLRNNIKLGKAKSLAQQAIEEVNEKNNQLIAAQDTLQKALLKAENADKLKATFLSNMDYQLRTPLNSIVGFSSLIPTFEDRSEIEFATEQIVENSERLLKMVEDIIELSQIESGNVHLVFEKLNLNDVFNEVVNKFAHKLESQVRLVFVPPLMSLSIDTDRYRLIQVLSNLTDNAVKFTPSGEIEIGYFAVDNNTIEFYVKDTGIGIDNEEIDLLFDRVYNKDSYVSGNGFGLSIFKKVIDLFAGEVGVHSKLGMGSRFWFRLKVDSYSKNL